MESGRTPSGDEGRKGTDTAKTTGSDVYATVAIATVGNVAP